jgi:hypothetical protein
VSQYVTEGLERAIEALKEAAALRERFGYNTTTNRKVASAVAIAVRRPSPSSSNPRNRSKNQLECHFGLCPMLGAIAQLDIMK